MKPPVYKEDLLYPELSYDIVGCAYNVWDELGAGHLEKVYQKAMGIAFKEKGLSFSEQIQYPVKFKSELVGKGILDFMMDEKIVVELKKDDLFSKAHIQQVLNYMKLSNCKLAILFNFASRGMQFKRIVNIHDRS
jgi:GxxExxY protein